MRGLPGVRRSIGWTEECVGVRCVLGLPSARCNAVQHLRTACNASQQYDTSQCRYIDKLGVGPILPLLHDIDAVAELQQLDVPVLVQRHAPVDGARARSDAYHSLANQRTRVCVCVCACACDPGRLSDFGRWRFVTLSLPSALITHAGAHDAIMM